ncbi:hypothetical protein [Puniceibacterium confluentis]|uniref:hypothetical protein n=1 Tax=Puniceibacterium confluentis TaxID=1958944 RepID=UPI0035642ABE
MPRSATHVTLAAAHTYRTSTTTRRTLPAGWSGYVPTTVATALVREKHGVKTPAADLPIEDDAADSGNSDAAGGGSGKVSVKAPVGSGTS